MGKIKCYICKKKCEGSVLKVQGEKYIHRQCFFCYTCKVNLESNGYFRKNDQFYCSKHYLEKFGVRCKKCDKIAEGEVIIFLGNAFHFQCFKCSNCSGVLKRGEKVAKLKEDYLCQACFSKRVDGAGNQSEKENQPDSGSKSGVRPLQEQNYESNMMGHGVSGVVNEEMCTSMASTLVSESVGCGNFSDSDVAYTPRKERLKEMGLVRSSDEQPKTHYTRRYEAEIESDSECRNVRSATQKASNHLEFYGITYTTYSTPNADAEIVQRRTRSFLDINSDYKKEVPNRAQYNRYPVKNVQQPSNIMHFHVPNNFFYRSTPNINSKTKSHMRSVINDSGTKSKTFSREKYKFFFGQNSNSNGNQPESSVKQNETSKQKVRANTLPLDINSPDDSCLDPILSSRSPGADFEPKAELRMQTMSPNESPSRTYRSSENSRINERGSVPSLHIPSLKLPIPSHNAASFSPPHYPASPQTSNQFQSYHNHPMSSSMSHSPSYNIHQPPSHPRQKISMVSNTTTGTMETGISNNTAVGEYYGPRDFLRKTSTRFSSSMGNLVQQTISYSELSHSSVKKRRDLDLFKLETYLNEDEFKFYFKMTRAAFIHLPEWKQNDLKRRVNLF